MYFSEKGNVDDDATLITIFLVSFNLQSCCPMQSAVCGLQSAVCSLQSAVCSLRSAVCGLQSAVCKCHTPHFTWSYEPRKGLAICRAMVVPSFFSYFKTQSIGPTLGIEPATSRSAVKPSTDWANPAAHFKWRGWSGNIRAKIIAPKKSLNQKLTPKNAMLNFQPFQKALLMI